MAADRHIGFRKMGCISGMDRPILTKFETHEKDYSCSEVTSKVALLEIQDGGRPPYLIGKNA
jgi:hypothetical protein